MTSASSGPARSSATRSFIDTHSWIRWHTKTDLQILGDSGTAVAHCPTPFARYGHIMENFGDYLPGRRHDGARHRLRAAQSGRGDAQGGDPGARRGARHHARVSTADLFHAATVGGATALMRDDLGRLAPGKKADLVLVDLECPQMQPARDPLRSFVYHAADRAVRDVFVDGQQVVADCQGHDARPGRRGRPAARRAGAHGGAGPEPRLPPPHRRRNRAFELALSRLSQAPHGFRSLVVIPGIFTRPQSPRSRSGIPAPRAPKRRQGCAPASSCRRTPRGSARNRRGAGYRSGRY